MILVACGLILPGLEGILTSHNLSVLLGNPYHLSGSLQNGRLGWANIGAAVAPDAALASIAAAIIMVKGGDFTSKGIAVATATAIPLAVAGLSFT